jgi:transposase-like protein
MPSLDFCTGEEGVDPFTCTLSVKKRHEKKGIDKNHEKIYEKKCQIRFMEQKKQKGLSIKLKKGDSAAGVIFIFKIRTPQL